MYFKWNLNCLRLDKKVNLLLDMWKKGIFKAIENGGIEYSTTNFSLDKTVKSVFIIFSQVYFTMYYLLSFKTIAAGFNKHNIITIAQN